MKVRIRDLASGKMRIMEEKFANVLVKMKRAAYVVELPPAIVTEEPKPKKRRGRKKKPEMNYETRMLEADV